VVSGCQAGAQPVEVGGKIGFDHLTLSTLDE
jgi:hypothetical protein